MQAISVVREKTSPSGWALQHTGAAGQVFAVMTGGRNRFPIDFKTPDANQKAKVSPELVLLSVRRSWGSLPAVVITLED
jgi:hypothetical protein